MTRQALIGTDLDQIAQSIKKIPSFRVLLFDPYADDMSDVVLNRYEQVPLDITPYVSSVSIKESHEVDANQASLTVMSDRLDYRLFMYSWVKIYEGDQRVDQGQWPCVFFGVFKGQPSRKNIRGEQSAFQHTAYDRSIYFRNKNVTSERVWNPEDTDANLGEICVEIATNEDWGMGLDRQEVLFGKFFRSQTTGTGTGLGTVYGGVEWRVNKKLQIADIPVMEALSNIMQVARLTPGFNGEGKLIARPLDLDRPPIRIYEDEHLIRSVDIPQNTMDLPTSVQVTGLDYRVTRVDYPYQRLMKVGPVTIGMFDSTITTKQAYSEDNEFRAVPDSSAKNIVIQGSLLTTIFSFDSYYSVGVTVIDDFSCEIDIFFMGAVVAVVMVTAGLLTYIAMRLAADELGSSGPFFAFLGFALDIAATILLLLVMETMRSIGTIEFEVWGTPFEYVYREIQAKAILSDTKLQEDQPTEIRNLILGTLDDVEELAQDELRRRVAMTANRTVIIASDPLIEPNDIIQLEEEGETARYFVLEVSKKFDRSSSEPVYDVTVFRCR